MHQYKARHLSVNSNDELVATYFKISAADLVDLEAKALEEVYVRENVSYREKAEYSVNEDLDVMYIDNGNGDVVLEVLLSDIAMFESEY
jgi:hypothetical protein